MRKREREKEVIERGREGERISRGVKERGKAIESIRK